MQKIGVTVLVAPPGRLRSTVAAHLLGDAEDWLVLAPPNTAQSVGHGMPLSVLADGPLVAAGCECCAVRGPLVDALRDHFMQALQRRRAPYKQVLCIQDPAFDPAGLVAALNHDVFLSQRYRYAGCLAAVTGQGDGPLPPAWLQADILLTQGMTDAQAAMLFSINPWAHQVPVHQLPAPSWLVGRAAEGSMLPRSAPAARLEAAAGGAGGLFSPASRDGGAVFQLAVTLSEAPRRGALYAALDSFLEDPGVFPLRLQGLVQLHPQGGWHVLRALHRHRQPLQELSVHERSTLDLGSDTPGGHRAGGFLCLLQSAGSPRPHALRLAQALGGQYRLLSPVSNPMPDEDARGSKNIAMRGN